MSVSSFYLACRNGDIATFDSLIPALSLVDMNRVEPNGSTVLHAASFYGHGVIVKRLLAMGAVQNILNKYNATPNSEAKNAEIKHLFNRPNGEDRFVENWSKSLWTYTANDADSLAISEYADTWQQDLQTTAHEVSIFFQHGQYKGKDQIQALLSSIKQNNDAVGLLRLYTAETDFYRELNVALANQFKASIRSAMRNTKWAMFFAGIVSRSTKLDHLRFQNYEKERTYRGMNITDGELEKYVVGEKIMNRSFLSTSKCPEVACDFMKRTATPGKQPVLCSYKLLDQRAAIELSSVSEFPDEQEVLIVPWLAFEVDEIDRTSVHIQIHLQQLPMDCISVRV